MPSRARMGAGGGVWCAASVSTAAAVLMSAGGRVGRSNGSTMVARCVQSWGAGEPGDSDGPAVGPVRGGG